MTTHSIKTFLFSLTLATLALITNTQNLEAQTCGSSCNWNGTPPFASCVASPGGSCFSTDATPSGCGCFFVSGCSGNLTSLPFTCNPTLHYVQGAPASCCGIVPPPPTPTPPPGGTPWPTSGPTSTPPPASTGCVTGDCFTGISNCGQVGRPNNTGSCSVNGNGGLCCAFAGGSGSCYVNSFSPNPITMTVGQTINLSTSGFNGIWETRIGNVRWSMGPSGSPWGVQANSVAQLGSLIGSGWTANNSRDPQSTTPVTNQLTGISPGTTFVRVDFQVYSINDGAYVDNANCNKAVPVTVLAPTTSCTIDLVPNVINISAGQNFNVSATATPVNGTISNVNFSSNNTGIATISPNIDNSSPYTSTLSGAGVGSTFVRATATMNNGTTCTDQTLVNVSATQPAWMHVNDGALISAGRVTVPIPDGNFLINTVESDEGVVTYSPVLNVPSSNISTPGWNVNNAAIAPALTHDNLHDQIPATSTVTNIGATITNTSLSGSPTDSEGFQWYRHQGNATISGPITIPSGRKVVLFVDGNLDINGTINLANVNGAFIMVVVSGSINVDTLVGIAATEPSPQLEGIFITDQQFITEPSTGGVRRLNVRGIVAANGGVNLQRTNPNTGNIYPSEVFTFAPELIINYPSALGIKRAFWKEVAP